MTGAMGEFPSGQRGQTVNLVAQPSQVRILLPPFGVDSAIAVCSLTEICCRSLHLTTENRSLRA